MSDDTSARDRRAANRRRRRGDDEQVGATEPETSTAPHLQEALKAAASAAAVGAAVGAARAYSSRRHEDEDEDDERGPEPEAEVEEMQTESEAAEEEPAREPEEQPEAEREPEPEPLPSGDLQQMVVQARRVLRDVQGQEAESVSSVTRSEGGWTVGLEVVEVRRIPDSTDVLATYEVGLDGDGGVTRLERVRRYRRADADGGRP